MGCLRVWASRGPAVAAFVLESEVLTWAGFAQVGRSEETAALGLEPYCRQGWLWSGVLP